MRLYLGKNMALSCCKIYFLGSNDWTFCKKARIVGERVFIEGNKSYLQI